MISKVFRATLITTLASVAGTAAAEAAELRAMELDASGTGAQISLDLSTGIAEKLFALDNPDRVVIDLPHTHLMPGFRTPHASGVVTQVRVGPRPGGSLRIVLQLRSALPARDAWGAEGGSPQLLVTLGVPTQVAVVASGPRSVLAAHAPGEGNRDVVIAVDAGHGGVDPGAIGHGGTREKDVTLAIARALAARINAEPGMRAVLTRNRDEFLELRERIARARAARADMFVSVHADSIADRSISGASVYVLSVHGASSEAARVLADRENAADLMGGIPVDNNPLGAVLIDATQSEIIGVSAGAAERVVNALEGVGEIRKAQVQRAGFVVLKSPAIPSMLVETAYISNPTEERRLRSTEQQARLADAIAGGIHSYFVQNPPDGTRFKQQRRSTLASAAVDGTDPSAPANR
jgi:N-acetylmuramoyl-L-alanine amidase